MCNITTRHIRHLSTVLNTQSVHRQGERITDPRNALIHTSLQNFSSNGTPDPRTDISFSEKQQVVGLSACVFPNQ
jgi:hypothetical protein